MYEHSRFECSRSHAQVVAMQQAGVDVQAHLCQHLRLAVAQALRAEWLDSLHAREHSLEPLIDLPAVLAEADAAFADVD
jgi:hypothetical protein